MESSKNILLQNVEIPPLGIYLKHLKSESWKDTCIPMFFAALLSIAKMRKQPKCLSMDESPCWFPRYMWEINIEYNPRSEIAGSCSRQFYFLRNLHNMSYRGCTDFYILIKMHRFSLSTISLPALVISCLFFFSVRLCIWVYMCDCVYVCEWVSEWERVLEHVCECMNMYPMIGYVFMG